MNSENCIVIVDKSNRKIILDQTEQKSDNVMAAINSNIILLGKLLNSYPLIWPIY